MNIQVEKISRMEDYKRIPSIQQNAWGFSDIDTEPHQMMTRVQKYGGLVLGLFLDERMIGFSYSIIGRWRGEYFMYSHMLAVEKEYQQRGFGFLLKKAQREEVMRMGYGTIRWNFDPLEAANSFFNIHRLGATVGEYEENVYGHGESGLHRGLATDRAIATWRLDSPRVEERMREPIDRKVLADLAGIRPGDFSVSPAYIEIPRDIQALKRESMAEALRWRMRTREWFETAFALGLEAREIVFSPDDSRVFFRLETR
jgi:predicted GNAT superfamily acetyltransferase